MVLKPEHEFTRKLLTNSVSSLCKTSLTYNKEIKVQGLLGITLDEEEVFVVHINERICDLLASRATEEPSELVETHVEKEQESNSVNNRKRRPCSKHSDAESLSGRNQPAKRNQDSTSQGSFDNIRVEQEKTDIVCIDVDSCGNVNIKPGPASFQNYGLFQQTPMISPGSADRTLGAQLSQTYQGWWSPANAAESLWNPGNNLPSIYKTDTAQEKKSTILHHRVAPTTQHSQPKQFRTILPNNQRIKCDFPGCTSTFQHLGGMYRHQQKLHVGWQSPMRSQAGRLEVALEQTQAEEKEASVPTKKKVPKFFCQFLGCGKGFVYKDSLTRHYRSKGHYPVRHKMDTGSMKGKFENDDSINDNGEWVEDTLGGGDMLDGPKKYQCEFRGCNVTFIDEKMLIDHQKETHSEWYSKKHVMNASLAEEDGVILNETPDDEKLMAMLLWNDGENDKEVLWEQFGEAVDRENL